MWSMTTKGKIETKSLVITTAFSRRKKSKRTKLKKKIKKN